MKDDFNASEHLLFRAHGADYGASAYGVPDALDERVTRVAQSATNFFGDAKCPGKSCITMTPKGRLCFFCRRTVGLDKTPETAKVAQRAQPRERRDRTARQGPGRLTLSRKTRSVDRPPTRPARLGNKIESVRAKPVSADDAKRLDVAKATAERHRRDAFFRAQREVCESCGYVKANVHHHVRRVLQINGASYYADMTLHEFVSSGRYAD